MTISTDYMNIIGWIPFKVTKGDMIKIGIWMKDEVCRYGDEGCEERPIYVLRCWLGKLYHKALKVVTKDLETEMILWHSSLIRVMVIYTVHPSLDVPSRCWCFVLGVSSFSFMVSEGCEKKKANLHIGMLIATNISIGIKTCDPQNAIQEWISGTKDVDGSIKGF
ncbi:hypothetical protein C2G38_2229933 [Gigaspora rosea]|uniref:Uncharacterized protein n=1 Tax=Gigaspora rosea TaxID=44941 RepID=A0A397TV78_9GLOM|nr:hypothetical protein C2G38_2229933 [Gigaspora rosea]